MQMNSSSTRFLVACRDAGIGASRDLAPAEPKAISSVLRAFEPVRRLCVRPTRGSHVCRCVDSGS